MQPLALPALSIISAVGRGGEATLAGLQSRRGALRPCDLHDTPRGGYVGRVAEADTHRLAPDLARFDCRNNRLADLALHTDDFAQHVRDACRRYGADRIAVVLGTSTAGILSAEEAYRRRDRQTGALPSDFNYEYTQDMFSLARFVRAALRLRGPALAVSTACASSARSFIDAAHFIDAGLCDAAVVGGADSLCRITLQGFAALELISPGPCRPCDAARDGISIGEAAGFALIERASATPDGASHVALLGYGATSDGYHMSSPDPSGAGAIGAMRHALATAGLAAEEVDYVNLHGTGTKANDAMEDAAVSSVFGPRTPCSSTKGWTGHTLGASGIVEAVIASLCIRHDLVPGCLGVGEVDPSFRSNVIVDNMQVRVRRAMSNSFGFGGINCSLLLGMPD